MSDPTTTEQPDAVPTKVVTLRARRPIQQSKDEEEAEVASLVKTDMLEYLDGVRAGVESGKVVGLLAVAIEDDGTGDIAVLTTEDHFSIVGRLQFLSQDLINGDLL